MQNPYDIAVIGVIFMQTLSVDVLWYVYIHGVASVPAMHSVGTKHAHSGEGLEPRLRIRCVWE